MRIVHVITSLQAHGAQMMLHKVLSRMDRSRFDSAVISLTDFGAFNDKFATLEIPVHSVGMNPGLPTPVAAFRLVRMMRRLEPDLVQGWMYHGNLAAQLSAVFTGAPVIWNIRASSYNLTDEKPLTAAIIWLGAKLSRLPRVIINNSMVSAVNHETKLSYCADKRAIIPNGFDTDLFSPSAEARIALRSDLALSESALLVGLIARYHPMKDHANFLQAVSRLSNDYPRAHFVMAGEGIDERNDGLRELIESLGLKNRAHLLGERKDMHRVAAGLDLVVSSSAFGEGFPNVIGEAMSCGVPCVATDVGDSSLVVGNTGRVVPPRNSEALARALREMLDMGEDQRRELGISARRRVVENYSLDAIVQEYECVYQQVVSTVNVKEAKLNVRYRWFC